MYLLQSFQKVQCSAQTKEQESGPGRPSKTQKPVKSRGVSYPKDGAAHELPLWGSKSKPASEVLG